MGHWGRHKRHHDAGDACRTLQACPVTKLLSTLGTSKDAGFLSLLSGLDCFLGGGERDRELDLDRLEKEEPEDLLLLDDRLVPLLQWYMRGMSGHRPRMGWIRVKAALPATPQCYLLPGEPELAGPLLSAGIPAQCDAGSVCKRDLKYVIHNNSVTGLYSHGTLPHRTPRWASPPDGQATSVSPPERDF